MVTANKKSNNVEHADTPLSVY